MIEIEINGKEHIFETVKLPEPFLQWQSEARMQMFGTLKSKGAKAVHMQPAHLPVLATMGGHETLFPINLATRGIGLLPNDDNIEEMTVLLENAKQETKDMPLEESLPRRVEAITRFYKDTSMFNDQVLGGLEIFEGQTAKNLKDNPLASLLFTGQAPKYPSYQFNGIVKIIEKGNSHYRFLIAARELFAMDAFHVHQMRYPFGYLFHVVEIKDKTPYPKR